jgi:hypothetical protein
LVLGTAQRRGRYLRPRNDIADVAFSEEDEDARVALAGAWVDSSAGRLRRAAYDDALTPGLPAVREPARLRAPGGYRGTTPSPRCGRFPTREEQPELDSIEDGLVAVLERNPDSLAVAVISTGMREFVYYTKDAEAVKRHFEDLRGKFRTHEIQLTIQPDVAWNTYRMLSLTRPAS